MVASLAEFNDPIGDRQMMLTLLRGLSGKFRHMVYILKMHRPFPTFAEDRTNLLLEELEIDARLPSPWPPLSRRRHVQWPPTHLHHHALGASTLRALLRLLVANATVIVVDAVDEAAPR
jgi:hypothetical protein